MTDPLAHLPSQLIMPKLGLTMTEGALAQWLVQPGQPFRKGDVLFIVETEKVANEIEAEADGSIERVLVNEGETVAVGTALAQLARAQVSDLSAIKTKPRVKLVPVVRDVPAEAIASSTPSRAGGRVIASPYARKLARAAGLELATVITQRVRITAADVMRALERQ